MTIIQHNTTAAEAPRLTGSRPTHYVAVDGSVWPFTVSHRVSFEIGGVRHFTLVDNMAACKKAMQVNAALGLSPLLHYMGTMTVEFADRCYPAGPQATVEVAA